MPLVPFIGFFGCGLSVGEDTGAPCSLIAQGPHELSVHPCCILYVAEATVHIVPT
ncbi:unnamed protein product [Staurois parvus]|uniref:Uncharacterized protein n=1 Tax=Staurois parvus TaxID=386267 RepID=A0ABN9FCX1_9NEOB|nr:unnamed protein product [Staurois parvus]